MINWMNVKVRYTKQLDNGSFKRVTEPYLLAAFTFTDAEARIYEELDSIIRGEFSVIAIDRAEIHDIFSYDDADTWFKCKVEYDSYGEGEKPKKTVQQILVSAHSTKEAYDRVKESLSSMLVDFEIPSVYKTKIVDIFPMREDLDRELSRTPAKEAEEVEE